MQVHSIYLLSQTCNCVAQISFTITLRTKQMTLQENYRPTFPYEYKRINLIITNLDLSQEWKVGFTYKINQFYISH